MKKLILVMISTVLCISGARAQKVSYIEEMQALGAVSGQGLACEATKYHTFEMLARAILVSKANSDEQQLEGMKAYNEHKVEAFISKIKDGFYNCRSIVSAFDKQKIFSMVLYGDGTIKMPDGSIITPRNPYDPNLVYQKDDNERQKYMDIYNEQVKKLLNNPAYKKVLREQQMRNGF
jgi:hypothetical protein